MAMITNPVSDSGYLLGEPGEPAGVECSTVDCDGELLLLAPTITHPQRPELRRAVCPECGLHWWVQGDPEPIVTASYYDRIRPALPAVLGGAVGAAVMYLLTRLA